MNVVLTVGHSRSVPGEVLAELLHQEGVEVSCILVASVFSLKRFRAQLRQKTFSSLIRKVWASFSNVADPNDLGQSDPVFAFARNRSISIVGLRKWCRKHNVKLMTVNDLNCKKSVEQLRAISTDLVVYCGGGILRKDFISASRYVLNAHAGPLPEIRGMCAAEWTFLLEQRSEISIHLIDQGIDTGPVIKSFQYDPKQVSSVSQLRSLCVVRGIEGLVEVIATRSYKNNSSCSYMPSVQVPQCFSLAPILEAVLQKKVSDLSHTRI